MFESRLIPNGFREDFFAEVTATMLAFIVCAVFYSFVGLMLRSYFDFPYWDFATPFEVYSQFLQNSLLGILGSMLIGVALTVYFVIKLVIYLLVGDYEATPAR